MKKMGIVLSFLLVPLMVLAPMAATLADAHGSGGGSGAGASGGAAAQQQGAVEGRHGPSRSPEDRSGRCGHCGGPGRDCQRPGRRRMCGAPRGVPGRSVKRARSSPDAVYRTGWTAISTFIRSPFWTPARTEGGACRSSVPSDVFSRKNPLSWSTFVTVPVIV